MSKAKMLSILLLGVLLGVSWLPAAAETAIRKGEAGVAEPARFTVSGVVLDENDEPAPGAAVLIKGSTKGVMTDLDGRFSIEVKEGDILVVQLLGFEDKEVRPTGPGEITVRLSLKGDILDEVTVVAFGTQRKASVIGAITTINTDALKTPVGQLSTSLAGKMAGLVVMQRTGEPGAGADFWIRGISTFGEYNRPLILVDGVERSMDLVDVDDIASFSILKDATATALYGVRGANGIVIITTKRGAESAPKVNVKMEMGTTAPVRLPKMANTAQWIDFYNDLYVDGGREPVISDYQKELYLSGADPDLYPSTDWIKTVYKDFATTARINTSVTGGTQKIRYYVGGSYYRENSILNIADNDRYDASMNFNRFNFRSNVDVNITKSTVLGLSLSTQCTIKNTPGGDLGTIYSYTLAMTPISIPPIYSDGHYSRGVIGANPYNELNHKGYMKQTNMTAQSLISLTQYFGELWQPLEGLQASVKFAWDATNAQSQNRYIRPSYWYALRRSTEPDEDGQYPLEYQEVEQGTNYMALWTANSSATTINLEASATYERVFADAHRVSGMFLFTMRNYQDHMTTSYIYAFPYRNMGVAGRATYSYKDRYFGEFNFGYNGSENFAPGHKYGFFPSIALGYIISNEPFWAPIKPVLTQLKFKGSYGKIGNDQIGGGRRFAFNTTMNTGAKGFFFGEYLGQFSSAPYNGITTGDVGNEAVAWEEAKKFNLGVETRWFDALSVNVDYFKENRDGIFIARQSTPSVVGLNVQPYVNVGRMLNRGVDVNVEFEKAFKDFFVSARANYSFNRNKVLYNDRPDQIWPYQNTVGYAHNQQRGLIAEGLFADEADIASWPRQTFGDVRPGDIKYRDVNADGVVDSYDMVPIGYTTVPEINYGFGVSLGYKGFDASIFFSGVDHVTRLISGQNLFGASTNIEQLGQIYADVAEHRWTPTHPDPNARYPRLSMNKVDNNQVASTFWQRDMSFLRLKNAEIGYTLPKKLTRKAGLSTVRLYVQGVNLATFAHFKLWDPELDANNGSTYPQMRTYNFGVNLNF